MTASTLEFARPGLRAWVRCERGSRHRLEDAWVACMQARLGGRPGCLFAVFDGMGGEPGGDVAARTAAHGAENAVANHGTLLEGLHGLNQAVLAGGGYTTAVLAFVTDGRVDLAHAGDSIAAMLVDGEVLVLTARDKAPDGRVSDFLGNPDLLGHSARHELPKAASLVLCTDGVDGVVGVLGLKSLLNAGADAVAEELEAVFAKIRVRGAPDNATLILIRRE